MNLKECTWPDLSEPYSLALQQAVEFIAARFDPLGIIACGSILRGMPDPSSDLDMYVIHHRPLRQRIQKTFNSVPSEIFVNPPAEIERYF